MADVAYFGPSQSAEISEQLIYDWLTEFADNVINAVLIDGEEKVTFSLKSAIPGPIEASDIVFEITKSDDSTIVKFADVITQVIPSLALGTVAGAIAATIVGAFALGSTVALAGTAM